METRTPRCPPRLHHRVASPPACEALSRRQPGTDCLTRTPVLVRAVIAYRAVRRLRAARSAPARRRASPARTQTYRSFGTPLPGRRQGGRRSPPALLRRSAARPVPPRLRSQVLILHEGLSYCVGDRARDI